ncbi:chitinase-3-like protein 1 [Dermacentor andersoni]|uniref:chitinase-3-like protein 1 n=1 Tax=Dermacentor andersoni TaxID=34620 RepID=UPI002155F8EB|nr:chitinase-3-like protein 1 [Dermacentor andersoni]
MKWATSLGLFLTLLVVGTNSATTTTRAPTAPIQDSGQLVVCYWNSWSYYRKGKGKSLVQKLDTRPCTHLVYNTVGIRGAEVVSADPWNDYSDSGGNGNLRRFANLKKRNGVPKLLVAVGGQSLGSVPFSKVALSEKHRKEFAESGVAFCREHRVNGLVVTWHYPASGGGRPQDKENFVLLLKEMKTAFNKAKLQLGVDLSVAREIVINGYNLPEIAKNVDFMTVNAFDYWGVWSGQTGPVAPLHGLSETDYTTASVAYSINSYLKTGVPRSKIVLAITTLGRTWTLNDTTNVGYGAFTSEGGQAGNYTQTSGALGYNEICESMKKDKWVVNYDKGLKASYAVLLPTWISYEDPQSAKDKAAFAREKQLGGIAIVTLDTDDFGGNCGDPFPILHAAAKEFQGTEDESV